MSINHTTGLITGTPGKAGDYDSVIIITDAARNIRKFPFTWTALESGGHFFVNPTTYVIPAGRGRVPTGRPEKAGQRTLMTS
ncbi:putative Ig domain-containing protein [Streptomyces sp. KL116D]|uniref:putative Ig domain-containing protein n=1 Tax=Streptomyces sp. KL116D TaxID=3045152 RepID=UPI0035585D7D